MNIVILAGGLGTRLKSVVSDLPKPMAPIDGVPFLELLMRELAFLVPERFILCVSHLREKIEGHFKDSFMGIPVAYSVETEPLGTGGAIKRAFDLFNLREALVLNGDSYIRADYAAFLKTGENEKLSIMLKRAENANRYGRVEVQSGRAVMFHEKEPGEKPGLINAGIYKIRRELFAADLPEKFSIEKDVLEPLVPAIKPPYMVADDYFIDIGLPESYARAQKELKGVILGRRLGKALFLDRDGVINEDVRYLHDKKDCRFMPGIFDFCRGYKERGYKLIVVTNQAGIAKGKFSESDYRALTEYIHAEFEKRGCPLDAEYYCPHHIDGNPPYNKNSFYRKPNPGLILLAAKELDIDLARSVLIGDSESDISAAKTAGVGRTIRLINPKNMRGSEETAADEIMRMPEGI
ncbi:MAG: D-glycero-beta-D-manno-heptose 1,7-bisphosphate 7-phosphatase [Opitutales bacterium]|nr:D-glycero-beta-D-manno-heptose 1,7-bisphosphate 7-phosphatase [Opitutales bacterium]